MAEPGAVSVAELEVSGPGAVSVAEPGASVAEPGASVAEPGVVFAAEPGAVFAAEPEVSAVVFPAAELSPGVAEPVVVSAAGVAEPQASADIAAAFAVLRPVAVVAAEADSSGRPRLLAFPNVDRCPRSSSSVEVVGWESVHSSTGARANRGLCSILSSPGLHRNKNLEQCCNNPSPGHSDASDTSDPAIGATTNRSRSTSPHLYRGQRKHRSHRASLSYREVPEMRRVAAEKQALRVPRLFLVLRFPVREPPLLLVAPVIGCNRSI